MFFSDGAKVPLAAWKSLVNQQNPYSGVVKAVVENFQG